MGQFCKYFELFCLDFKLINKEGKYKGEIMQKEKGSILIVLLIILLIFIISLATWWFLKPKNENVVDQKITTINYTCDDQKNIRANYLNDKVDITLSDNRSISLAQSTSASGVRYTNIDESIVFWEKGETAFIEENGIETYSNCTELSTLSGSTLEENTKNIEKLIENFMLAKKSRDLKMAKPYMTNEFYDSTNQETFAGPSSPQMEKYEISSIDYLVNEDIYKITVKIYQNLQGKEVGYNENIYEIIDENKTFLIDNEVEGDFIENKGL